MKKKIIKFVRYHNAFVVMMVLAMVGVGSVFANEDVRDAVIGEEVVVEIKGLDNSAILACDLDAFDAMMQIVGVTADTENYFVEYTYQTLAIEDNAWQEITRQETLNVSKAALEGRELGIYLIEELGEIVESELAFLKEVQEKELTKGATEIVEIIDTTGLLGLLSDIVIKYKPEPVAPPARAPVAPVVPAQVYGCMDSIATNYNSSATEDNGSCVYSPLPPADALVCVEFFYSEWGECSSDGTQIRSVLTSLPDGCVDGEPVVSQTCEYVPASDLDPAPVCGADNLNLCLTESDCSAVLGFWYNEVCNSEAALICDTDNLDLCDTQALCEGAGLYWYNDICNTSAEETPADDEPPAEEPPANEPPADVCGTEHIDLCDTQALCEGAGLYWYNDVCNPETQIILGCMDSTATNYNAQATQDDGTCEYPPAVCESFTYSDWGECQADGTQTRTILTSLPDGCEGGEPVISQSCDYKPEPASNPDPE